MTVFSACLCDIGKVRAKNEDNFYFSGKTLSMENHGCAQPLFERRDTSALVCYAVFDGMGGEKHGALAAYIAAQTLAEYARQPLSAEGKELVSACLCANERICAAADENGGGRMGSTAAILLLAGTTAVVCNIGDSRVFRLRGGELSRLSVDHTDRALLDNVGARGRKPALTQHLGIWPHEMQIEPHVAFFSAEAGEQYLLCSDGLTDMLDEACIAGILEKYCNSAECVSELVRQALLRGGRDNITAVVCKLS